MQQQQGVLVLVVALLVLAAATGAEARLSRSHYARACPNVEALVRGVVAQKLQETFNAAPGTLRLFFHDCFVRGCDASVLLSGPGDEHSAGPDTTLSPDALDLITRAKAAVEAACAHRVSCADVLALATRDVVQQVRSIRHTVVNPSRWLHPSCDSCLCFNRSMATRGRD